VLTMWTAGFPEPKTFSKRVARILRDRLDDFDIVHDNQVLGYGMLDIAEMGFPLITSIHHPITFDRRIDIEAATTRRKKLTLRRWYGFLKMQGKVARSVGKILTVSESSRRDIVTDFGVDQAHLQVIPLGVDDVFGPPSKPRVAGRIVAMASADAPMKGIATLLEAFAKLRTERDVELVLVTRPTPGGRTEKLIERLGIAEHVAFVNGISDAELVEVMGSAELACVPSLYEGFSLPTAELMACETPLVVSRAGAIPEVVGPDGECADLVAPGDVGELENAIAALLDDPERRARMGKAGRRRVLERFSWRAVAEATAAAYDEVIASSTHTTTPEETARAHR
jgi:glycosyltransferase involved in cell wall biosynthesis